jgi:hypothetical protein
MIFDGTIPSKTAFKKMGKSLGLVLRGVGLVRIHYGSFSDHILIDYKI